MADFEVKGKISGDASGIDKATSTAEKGLKKLGDAATDATKAASKLNDALQKELAKAMEDLASHGGAGAVALVKLGAAGAIAATGLVAVGVAIEGLKKLGDLASEAVDFGGKLADLSAKTGISAEGLQRLQKAGSLTGNSMEQVASAVSRMQRALIDTPKAFDAIGLSAERLANMAPDQAFNLVASSIAAIQNPAERTAAAMEIFGKSGAALLPMLTSNIDAAGRMGAILDNETINALDATGDAATSLANTWGDLWKQMGASVGSSAAVKDSIEGLTGLVQELAISARQLRESGMIGDVVKQAIESIRILAATFTLGLTEMAAAILRFKATSDFNNYRTKGAGFGDDAAAASPDPFGAAGQKRLLGDKAYDDQIRFYAQSVKGANDAAEAAKKYASALDYIEVTTAKLAAKNMKEFWDDQIFQANKKNNAANAAALALLPQNWEGYGQAGRDMGSKLQGSQNQGLFAAPKKTISDWQEAQKIMAGVGNAVGNVADLFSVLGMKADSAGAKAINALQGILQAGSHGDILGMITAGIGGIASLFGGGAAKREEARKQREADQKSAMDGLKDLADQWDKFESEMSARAGGAASSMFTYMASNTKLTADQLGRMGAIGVATFNAMVASGKPLLEALDAMGDGLDKLVDEAAKRGMDLGPLASLVSLKGLVNDNRELVDYANQMGGMLDYIRLHAGLTADSFAQFQAAATDAFSALIEKGFSVDQAISVMGPTLLAIAQAATQLGIDVTAALDTVTGGHGAEAAKALEGMQSPMDKLIDIQNNMLQVMALIATAFGQTLPESVQKYIDKLNQIPKIQGPPGTDTGTSGGTGAGDSGGGDTGNQGYASGGIASGPASGHWELLHGTEMVLPMGGGSGGNPLESMHSEIAGLRRDMRFVLPKAVRDAVQTGRV